MTMWLDAAIIGSSTLMGVVLGYGAALMNGVHETTKKHMVEYGFRMFIDHHVDGVDRDGDVADEMWSYARRKEGEESE